MPPAIDGRRPDPRFPPSGPVSRADHRGHARDEGRGTGRARAGPSRGWASWASAWMLCSRERARRHRPWGGEPGWRARASRWTRSRCGRLNDELLQLARRAGDRSMVMDTLQTIEVDHGPLQCDAEGRPARTWTETRCSGGMDPRPRRHRCCGARVVLLARWRGEPLDDALARLDGLVHALSQPGSPSIPRARGRI